MMTERRIAQRSSRTAAYTCACRAASNLSQNPLFHSEDYIAVQLLPKFLKGLLKCGLIGLHNYLIAPGLYEYVIARTRYFDEVFRLALKARFDQVFILGAGFDSRAIRMLSPECHSRVYEIDAPPTQAAKQSQLHKRGIKKPDHLVYIPIDFTTENLKDKLLEYGLRRAKSLFLLEGLIMYLDAAAVDEIFRVMYDFSAPGSRLVFDAVYASVVRQENRYYGEAGGYRQVKRAGEAWLFGLEEHQVANFLQERHFNLVESLNATRLEQRNFVTSDGRTIARVNGTHLIIQAEVVSAG